MNERPAAPAKPATSNDITPGPFSEHELREAWNRQADEFNQWDSLETCEQLAWAQARAVIAADRAGRPAPVEPGRVERLPDGKPYPTPPAEGEAAELAAALQRRAAQNLIGTADPTLTRAAKLLLEQAAELVRLRRQQSVPPVEGEVGELVAWLQRTADVLVDGNTQTPRLSRAADLLQQQAAELAQCREALRRVRLQQRIPGGGW